MRCAIASICLAVLGVAGCSFGPRTLEKSHGRYNEAFVQVDSEELLLNIVRLRYNDPPAEVEVSAIAAQYELGAQAEGRPFFLAPNPSGSTFMTFQSFLPFVQGTASSRPTITLTPIHSGETIGRYLRPITAEGVVFFAETSWPISTVLRLWLEDMNGVPNAPSASGPPRSFAPEYAEFRRAVDLLQTIQDRGDLTFRKREEEVLDDPIALNQVNGDALVEARKAGFEYRLTPDKTAWQLVRKVRKLYLDFNPRVLDSPEHGELVRVLNLKPGLTRYEVTQSTIGFIDHKPNAPPSDKLVLVTRSFIQVIYYCSHGVDVPCEHLESGVAKTTREADGTPFDWRQLNEGLFTVRSSGSHKRPACASVAVRYRGYWFYIDDADQATKSTFVLLRPARQLDLGAVPTDKRAPAPVLTLPVGR